MENIFEHSRGTISSSPQKEGAPPRRPSLGFEEAFILGYNVERFRRDARMDVATLARVAGVARPTIYKVERGESDLKLSYLRRLAEALGVTIVDLLSLPSYANGPEFCRYSCRARAFDRHKNAHYIPHSRMDACDEELDEGLETGSSDEL